MENAIETISRIRKEMGDQLAILGHHYQSDQVIEFTDIRGDSLELSRMISELTAKYIVFCGVYFMAESAAILRRKDQQIFIPDTSASCPMADMAEAQHVEETLSILQKDGRKVIPLTYVNSSADVKGVVGRFGGSVCTSANAQIMLEWACKQGDAVLFLPDKHLAKNTATTLGIPSNKQYVLPRGVRDGDPQLYIDLDIAKTMDLFIWPGYCPIHDEFTIQRVAEIRSNEPESKIVVHPECDPAVVQAADGNGSTTYLIKYASQAPAGSTTYIGTEYNLVNRLAQLYNGEKIIKPLDHKVCDDMGKTTLENLAELLLTIKNTDPVEVAAHVKEPAKIALERMLTVCS